MEQKDKNEDMPKTRKSGLLAAYAIMVAMSDTIYEHDYKFTNHRVGGGQKTYKNVNTTIIYSNGGKPYKAPEKIGRNEICPKCESGLKYKKCCGAGK